VNQEDPFGTWASKDPDVVRRRLNGELPAGRCVITLRVERQTEPVDWG